MKVTTASVLVLLALCTILLLARGQAGPQQLWGPVGSPLLPRPFPPSNGYRRWCPHGEIFKRCVSSTCGEHKCYQLGVPGVLPCTLDCVSGCFCKRHLYRNYRGRCVPPRKCPKWRPRPRPLPAGRPE
uniref:Putative tick til 11 n=1 Tax=Amblyomma parvum TaxID=251391 RepID=A0A023FYJ6_AMBPA